MSDPRRNKYRYVHVTQANYGYGHGWEDIGAHDTRADARAELRVYCDNMPEYPYRVVSRRVPNV